MTCCTPDWTYRARSSMCTSSTRRRDGRAPRRSARCRRPTDARRADRTVRPARGGGDRVDDRCPLRPRHIGALRPGRRDCRRGQGEGSGAPGRQDGQDRRAGTRRAGPAGVGAGDLAARSIGSRRARAGALPAVPGSLSNLASEPDPRHAHRLWPVGAGVRPVREARARVARLPANP